MSAWSLIIELIKKATKKWTPPKKRKGNENILEDGEENEHEQLETIMKMVLKMT